MRWILYPFLSILLLFPLACKDKKSPAAPPPAPPADTATFTPTLPPGSPTATPTVTRTNTLPIGFSSTWTFTSTRTGTPTVTPTGTATRTITPFPTPYCSADAQVMGCTSNDTYTGGYYSTTVPRIWMVRHSLDRPASITSLGVQVAEAGAGTSIRLALYSDNGGNPLIYLCGSSTAAAVRGPNTLGVADHYVPPGNYWIAVNAVPGSVALFDPGEDGIGFDVVDYPDPTPFVFPNPPVSATPAGMPYAPCLWADFCPLPTFTPTVSPTVTSTPTFVCTVLVSPTITPQVHSSGYETDYCAATPGYSNPPLGLGSIPVATPANPVDRQRAVTGVFTPGDIDYFVFTAQVTGTYVFLLDCFDSGSGAHDADLFLWNPACPTSGWLATTFGMTGPVKSMIYTLTAGVNYYLTAREMTTTSSGSYRMVIVSP